MSTTRQSVRPGPWRRASALLATVAVAVLVAGTGGAAPAQAQPAYDAIVGSGSTWSQNAIEQWVQDVRPRGLTVSYSGSGSSVGRKQFAEVQADFGVSEIPYQGSDPLTGEADDSLGRDFAYMPIVAGGTAFMYHLRVGGQLYRGLRLSGATVARIFTGQIRNWNDPAITADNNGRALPDKQIIPIVRGDGSGTTAQFTRWMNTEHPGIWREYCGCDGLTSYYPVNAGGRAPLMTAQSGSDRVSGAVAAESGDGAITYVEYSYANGRNFPVAKVLNNGGYYVEPTAYNVAVALTKADINRNQGDPNYLTQILDGVYRFDDPRTYPLSSYSYAIIPAGPRKNEAITPGKARTMADFMFYFLCTGQGKAESLGYSPLPANLAQAGFDQVARIPNNSSGRPDIASCQNPTFDGADLNKNVLATDAPLPLDCDRVGQGPCAPGQSVAGGPADAAARGNGAGGPGGADAAAAGAAGPGGGAAGPGGGTAGPAGAGADGAADAAALAAAAAAGDEAALAGIDPETGLPLGAGGAQASGSSLYGSPTEVAAYRNSGLNIVLAGLLAVATLMVILVPPFVGRSMLGRGPM